MFKKGYIVQLPNESDRVRVSTRCSGNPQAILYDIYCMTGKKRASARVNRDTERLKVMRYLAFKKGTTIEALLRKAVKDFLEKQ